MKARRLIEFFAFLNAFITLVVFLHFHHTFVRLPVTCLDHLFNSKSGKLDYDRSGILRIELVKDLSLLSDHKNLTKSYLREYQMLFWTNSNHDSALYDSYNLFEETNKSRKESQYEAEKYKINYENQTTEDDFISWVEADKQDEILNDDVRLKQKNDYKNVNSYQKSDNNEDRENKKQNDANSIQQRLRIVAEKLRKFLTTRFSYFPFKYGLKELQILSKALIRPDYHIIEYALEYGLLRLSPRTRFRLNVPVTLVTIDLSNNSCVSGRLNRLLLEEMLGYEDLLLSSVRRVADLDGSRGYIRNTITGDSYQFTSAQLFVFSGLSYILAAGVMLIFTLSISVLLRYSHHQIFLFIGWLNYVDLMHILNNNHHGALNFPIASLLTVILALVGMETIMTEFFNDTTTAFYIILMVWAADQYDGICSQTRITRVFWPRFFYLYQLMFYVHHYRFHGQFSGLALLTTWVFTLHAMIFFFHHYELPFLLMRRQIHLLTRPHTVARQMAHVVGVQADALQVDAVGQSQSTNSDSQSELESNWEATVNEVVDSQTDPVSLPIEAVN